MNQNKAKHKFTYAVIADTHLNENEDECNSPFDVNRLANRRLRYVIHDLNQREIALVIHLGDVVHPVPSMGLAYEESARQFHEQMSFLKHPLYVIPGNHDVGDKHITWGPAGKVTDKFLTAWTKHFGDHYFKVFHQDIAFVGINAQLIGSGLKMESEQKQWLELTLKELSGKRVYIFTHYPPFLVSVDEHEHYDNLAKKGRKWLLGLIDQYQVEALFAGHVHQFWYNQVGDCQCYLLPSTAFTRQDYSEMFRAQPEANSEFGRNDKAKLGYLLVHVHEKGHFIEMVRCYGCEQSFSKSALDEPLKTLDIVNPVTNSVSALGFDLRQDWTEIVQIPPYGALDEFDRKLARNDYVLLALWEMGIRQLRIPFTDLRDKKRRERLLEMQCLGFQFTLYSFGIPDEIFEQELFDVVSSLIISWEVCWPVEDMNELLVSIEKLHETLNCSFIFSPLRSKEDILASGKTYYHVINHGYTYLENPGEKLLAQVDTDFQRIFSSNVLRCGFEDSVWQMMKLAEEITHKTGLENSIHLRLAADNPAQYLNNDAFICRRLIEAVVGAWVFNVSAVYCDTLVSNDRGYFPRAGLLDRWYNPKEGFHWVRSLHALLSAINKKPSSFRYENNSSNTVIEIQFGQKKLFIAISDCQNGLIKIVSRCFAENSDFSRLNHRKCVLNPVKKQSIAKSIEQSNSIDGVFFEVLTDYFH